MMNINVNAESLNAALGLGAQWAVQAISSPVGVMLELKSKLYTITVNADDYSDPVVKCESTGVGVYGVDICSWDNHAIDRDVVWSGENGKENVLEVDFIEPADLQRALKEGGPGLVAELVAAIDAALCAKELFLRWDEVVDAISWMAQPADVAA